MRVLKDDLITEIAQETGLTKWRTKLFLQGFVDVVVRHMLNGDSVLLRQFGTFYIKKMPEQVFNTDRTNGKMILPARDKVKFKVSRSLREVDLY